MNGRIAGYNADMRYRLRTLLLVMAVVPPLLGGAWWFPQAAVFVVAALVTTFVLFVLGLTVSAKGIMSQFTIPSGTGPPFLRAVFGCAGFGALITAVPCLVFFVLTEPVYRPGSVAVSNGQQAGLLLAGIALLGAVCGAFIGALIGARKAQTTIIQPPPD